MTGEAVISHSEFFELKERVLQLEIERKSLLDVLKEIREKQDQAHDDATDFRHRMANSQQGTDKRIARVEAVICPDPATGQKTMGERVAAIEKAVLTANVGWRTMAKIGGVLVLCAGGAAWIFEQAMTIFGGAPPHH